MQRDDASRPTALVCHADRLAFPLRDGIPVMLEGEARSLDGPPPPSTTTPTAPTAPTGQPA
jgi:hypothetical protein